MDTATRSLILASLLAAGCSAGPGQEDGDGIVGDGDGDALVGDGDGIVGDGDAGVGGLVGDGDAGVGGLVGDGDGDVGDGDVGDGDGDTVLPSADNCTPGIAPTSQIPRLKNVQYDNTIRDLLGLTALASGSVPSSVLEVDHTGGMTELGWSSYKTVASQIAAQVMGDAALKANFLACDESAAGCLSSTIVDFGRRAFRRPLSDAEVALFETIVAKGATITETGAASEVAEVLLYTFLVSPSFIMRSEVREDVVNADGNVVLSSHEVASRLSYTMWNSMPDAELSAAADADMLQTPEQVLAQAERMIALPNGRQMVSAFHRAYLLMTSNSRWDSANKDPALFPEFTADLVVPMAQETETFFDYIAYNGGTFRELLLDPTGFVNDETAAIYDVPAPGSSELTMTTLDANQRPGFLTRLAFLNGYSGYNRTSPILRGAYIIQDVLGIEIGAPPPGAADEPLPPATEVLDTNRKQVNEQTSPTSCANCHHAYVNPPGFVMESFDSIGRYRTEESPGIALDTVADVVVEQVVDAAGEEVNVVETMGTPLELMTAIANSPGAQHYYAQQWVSFAFERGANGYDTCIVDELGANIATGGYTILQMITDLTQTESFRARATGN
jgi:hypothetical protein